jgi:hypothetical protein
VRRTFRIVFLCLSLLGLQQQLAVHAYAHLPDPGKAGYTLSDEDAACPTCELLASGANGLASCPASAGATSAALPTAPAGFSSRAVAAPACYSSRAPPALS